MSLLRTLGKKHVDILSQWVGSAAVFGASAGVAVTYFTDWKLVCFWCICWSCCYVFYGLEASFTIFTLL
ncbi:Ubiquinol-cytochrome C reductase complex, 6.4kD protein [Popillia japonica]|uniref:Ubiquinol-cytochrome C reductase complex, 6.4kD protein n=1 Tax=Popillia japonica TaxID=7064 RepID=A0AAW1MZI2_POPJA